MFLFVELGFQVAVDIEGGGVGRRMRVVECQRRSKRQMSSDVVRREMRGMERCTKK
jgi:hypothetical protein